MVFYQTFHGSLYHGIDRGIERSGGFVKHRPVQIGYGADKTYRQYPITIILGHIAYKKGFKLIEHQTVYSRFFDIFQQKRCY